MEINRKMHVRTLARLHTDTQARTRVMDPRRGHRTRASRATHRTRKVPLPGIHHRELIWGGAPGLLTMRMGIAKNMSKYKNKIKKKTSEEDAR